MPAKMTSLFLMAVLLISACKTLSDVREEQEMDRLKHSLQESQANRADSQQAIEELKMEIVRLNSRLEEQSHNNEQSQESLRQKNLELTQRIATLESEKEQAAQVPKIPISLKSAKQLYDKKEYEEAIQVLKQLSQEKLPEKEQRDAQYLLSQSYFANRDFALAALEFGKFKKLYPKDSLVPNATFRQAACFKNLNKPKEAKLFFQELLEKYPNHKLSKQAKKEIASLK